MIAHSWLQIVVYKLHQRVALTREQVLLGKKGIDGRTNQFQKTLYTGLNYCVRIFVTTITTHGKLDSVI